MPSQLIADDEVVALLQDLGEIDFGNWGFQWVGKLLQRKWEPSFCAKIFLLLPFREEIWERVYRRTWVNHMGAALEAFANVRTGIWKWELYLS